MKSNLYIFLFLIAIGCANPKSSYLNLDRLKKIDDLISEDIKENKIPGAVVLVGNEDEIIFEKHGIINEGSKSNIFVVKKGKVYTPSLSQNILPGVTRNFIINLLRRNNIEILEEKIPVDSIYECDELWLTSSTKEIQPVAFVDDYQLPKKNTDQYIWKKVLGLFNPY